VSSSAVPATAIEPEWKLPNKGDIGMYSLIVGESSIFTIFVVAYIFYIGKSLTGPTPREALEVPVFPTICLLSSSVTMHAAISALRKANLAAFRLLWFATFALGLIFLIETGREWHHLIYEKGLTISTNLFGTTYYSLVGLHAFHVTVGLIALCLVLLLSLAGKVTEEYAKQVDVLAIYWHFVDAVWVVVFTVVYIVGR